MVVYTYNAERVDYIPGIADFQYLRARYYAPNLGRFIQQDIVWGTIQTPLSQNLFIYCQNNAVNMIDPSGHRAMNIDGGGSGGYTQSELDRLSECKECQEKSLNPQSEAVCKNKTSITINDAATNSVRTYCEISSFPINQPYGNKILLVVFDGINSPGDENGFKKATDMIAQMLAERNPSSLIYGQTYYDYGVNQTDDIFSVIHQATYGELYASEHAEELSKMVDDFNKIYFVGYSGGGTSAARTAEKLYSEYGILIDSMVRVGTPMIAVGNEVEDRTTDLYLSDDFISKLIVTLNFDIPRYTLDNQLVPPIDGGGVEYHTSYWKKDTAFTDLNGKTNLWKTSSQVVDYLEGKK